MSDNFVLSATARERVGKGSARAARREGQIPAVIYGDKKAPLSINLNGREMVKLINQPGFFTNVYDVELDGKKHQVLPRDVQFHPVTDVPLHFDLLRVGANTEVTIEVPVEFINEDLCPGLKVGGVLNVVRYTVEIVCTPDKMPDSLTIDLDGWDVGSSIHISAVDMPEGARPAIDDRDFTVATIASPSGGVKDEDEEGEEGEEGVEDAGGEEAAASDGDAEEE